MKSGWIFMFQTILLTAWISGLTGCQSPSAIKLELPTRSPENRPTPFSTVQVNPQ